MYRKGAQDKKRSAMFSKLSREITVAAKMGTARSRHEPAPARGGHRRRAPQSMPKDNIQRAINKALAATPRIMRRSATRASARAASR